MPATFAWIMTFVLVMFAWVPFRIADVQQVMTIWQGMAGMHGLSLATVPIFDMLLVLLVYALTLVLPNCHERHPGNSGLLESSGLWLLAILAVYNSPQTVQFIYFQF